MSRDFLQASVIDIVKELSLEEKIQLLAGHDWWNTSSIDRLGIPAIRISDGPNGVRGSSFFLPTPAQCLPCATSMASTFDKDLLFKAGVLLGQEAKLKSAVMLLAPTCNIQRNPLGGRAFESFSEDPHLSGTLASSYIEGVQSEGVASTMKHFVGNDQEHERTAAESVMSDRALREIYLYPFMLAQRKAKPGAFLTSYGRIKGVHCSENPTLLKDILRKEWGFDGIVTSDWFGAYSVDNAINARLDLEMPGPPRWRTPLLVEALLSSQNIQPSTLDELATDILNFVQRQARRNPEVVFGDGQERSSDSPEVRAFCRKLAAEGMVVLKNEGGLLPLKQRNVKRIALIGPNMKDRVISGGGSAALKATYIITPYTGFVDNAPKGVEMKYELGCYSFKFTPTLEQFLKTPSGEPGWLCSFFNNDKNGDPTGDPVQEFVLQDTSVMLNDSIPTNLTPTWTIKLRGSLTMDKTAKYQLGLTVSGRARLFVNGKLTIDNWTKQRPGDFFMGQGSAEEMATISLTAGKPVDILVEYTNTNPPSAPGSDQSQPALLKGVRLGGFEIIDPEEALVAAEKLAAKSDAVIVVAGLSPDWEGEGFDRSTLDMPGRQNELIARVGKANPNTVVCLQAGSAVAMPWVNQVKGIIQAWYSGNEVGNALADVVYGAINPGGRLPLSLPVRVQDIPSFPNFRSENKQIHYREDLFVGYKGYQSRDVKPLFPFGHGLSYTSFSFSKLVVFPTCIMEGPNFEVDVTVTIKNTGSMAGSEVVQVYVSLPDIGLTTPKLQLRGFTKARDIAPGKKMTVTVRLDKYAVSWWDTIGQQWKAVPGTYGVHVGKSSSAIELEGQFVLEQGFTWFGL